MVNFRTKFSLAMDHISPSVCILINKIVVFGVLTILKYLKRGHCIQEKSMFGAHFGPNDDETTVTINSDHYGHIITDFLPSIKEYNLVNMWFQQDSTTMHTTRANMTL